MNHMDLLTGYVDISRSLGVTSPDYRVFSIAEHCPSDPGYLLYVFQMGYKRKILYAYGQGSSQLGRWRLPTEGFQEWSIPFPSREEQVTISTFLDNETAKIDALIAEQQRLIELLQEKRQAVISHAVTKGLNPDAPMKDSGVEWLGEVPEHWEVRPLAHLTNLLSYGFTNPMPTSEDGPFMLTANDIGQGSIRFETARRTTPGAFESLLTGKSRPEKDDILITKDGTLGRVAIHDGSLACVNQSVAVMRVNQGYLIPGFASASLMGGVYQDRMVYEAGGTTIKHIYIYRAWLKCHWQLRT